VRFQTPDFTRSKRALSKERSARRTKDFGASWTQTESFSAALTCQTSRGKGLKCKRVWQQAVSSFSCQRSGRSLRAPSRDSRILVVFRCRAGRRYSR
jgi:hypothetical protein